MTDEKSFISLKYADDTTFYIKYKPSVKLPMWPKLRLFEHSATLASWK